MGGLKANVNVVAMMHKFNEAKLRGIDMAKLRRESFGDGRHFKMIREHENRKKMLGFDLAAAKPVVETKPDTPKRVLQKKPLQARNVSRKHDFTPTQIAIAIASLEKKEKQNGKN